MSSLLSALASASKDIDELRKDEPNVPKDLYRIILSTLHAHGLENTAQQLKQEARLDEAVQTKKHGAQRNIRHMTTSDFRQARAEEKAEDAAVDEAVLQQRRQVENCAGVVSEQRQRLDSLREKVRVLREGRLGALAMGGKAAAIADHQARMREAERRIQELNAECDAFRAIEAPLREELRQNGVEMINVRDQIDQRKREGADLRTRLQLVQAEVAKLRQQKEHDQLEEATTAPQVMAVPVSSAAPNVVRQQTRPPPESTEHQKILWLLEHWDRDHGICRLVAPKLFAHADTDKDGYLRWNEGEIRQFVKDLFGHYNMHVPYWQDRVWYELYRQCDQNGDYALELSEIMKFAQHCFTLAEHSYKSVPEHRHRHPIGHGYTDTEVAGTIQSVLASALNHQGGGVLYNVTVDIFTQLDRNHDVRIEWNNGEVKGFVTALFNRYGVPMPPWPDQVWYDMYHKCDIERRHSINIEEALMFAKICFESALNALVATPRSGVMGDHLPIAQETLIMPAGSGPLGNLVASPGRTVSSEPVVSHW